MAAALCLGTAGASGAQDQDPDLDGLSNADELSHGTDPYNSDTDGGGENDGSEVDFYSDPLDPSDDAVVAINCIAVRPEDSAAIFVFQVEPGLVGLRLYRRSGIMQPYVLVDGNIAPTGEHTDTGLINGRSYSYRMLAFDSENRRSAVTSAVRVIPASDAIFSDGFECRTCAWSAVIGE